MPTTPALARSDRLPIELPWCLLGVAAAVPTGSRWLIRLQSELDGELRVDWAHSLREALQRVRQTAYSAIVIGDMPFAPDVSTHPAEEFVRALRATGDETPVVVLLPLPHDELVSTLLQLGCEVSVTPRLWDAPSLPTVIATAVRRAHQRRELEHLRGIHHRRLARDQADAVTLMQLQQQSLERLVTTGEEAGDLATEAGMYESVLRNYLVAPEASLRQEIDALVAAFYRADWGPQAVRACHVSQLERLLADLGGRASRQILARANVMAIDVITQLGEHYRRAA